MSEPTPIDLPAGLRWVKLVCRLGRLVTDSAADENAYPDLLPVEGKLTLSTAPIRIRVKEADGRWRSVDVAGRTYTIRSDGELVDQEGRVGVYIPDPASPLVEPQNYAITAVVKPTGGFEWRVILGGSTALPDEVDLVAVSSVGPVSPSVTASFDARLYALEQGGGGGGGTGSGIELASGTVTLSSYGAPVREFYCTSAATINGVSFPAGTAVVWRRTIGGQWGYIVVDDWTAAGSAPDPGLITVTATAPNWTDDATNGGGTWTTPTITGVTYSPASGTATPGQTVTVTAAAQSGYQLSGTASWTHQFPAAQSTGPEVVQTRVAIGTSVTLDAAPTPGNLLVVGVGSSADPAGYTYSHALTLDGQGGPAAGWHVGMASGVVASGDSATVAVTGMGSNPRVTVWEVAGVSGKVADGTAVTGGAKTELDLTLAAGDLALVCIHADGATGGASGTGGLTVTSSDTRGISGQAEPASHPWDTKISWTSGRQAAGIVGGYS